MKFNEFKLSEVRNPNKIWHFMNDRPVFTDNCISPPISIEIQPTSACNLRCTWCSYWDRNGFGKAPPQSMDFSIISDIANFASKSGTKSIYIAGGGEPCAYKGIKDMVDLFSSKGLSLAMITNGTLFAKRLSDQADKFSYLQISLISSNIKNYRASSRSNLGYEEMHRLPSTIKEIHSTNAPIMGGMYVITRWNYMEALDAIAFCKENSFDYCSFRPAIDFEGRGVELNKEIVHTLQINIKQDDKNFSNIETTLNNALLTDYEQHECLNIHYGFYCIVDPHGGVFLCIPDVGRQELCIGNLYQTPFEEIWGGLKHKKIVQNLEARYKCKGCHYACRSHAYNRAYQLGKPKDLPNLHKHFV